MLEVRCPGCAKLLQVVETATDRDSVCPACGLLFRPDAVRGDLRPAGVLQLAVQLLNLFGFFCFRDCHRLILYALAAASTAEVSTEIPGPMVEEM